MYEQRKPKIIKRWYYVFYKMLVIMLDILCCIANVHENCSMKTFPLLSIGLKNLCLQFPELDPLYQP